MPSRRLDCSAGIPAGMPDPQSVTLVEYLLAYSRLKDRGENLGPAWLDALELIRRKPEDWFHDQPADDRDLALINAKPMSCFNLGETSFLKKMSHKVVDEEFKLTSWTHENEDRCKRMIRQAGSEFIGFGLPPANEHRPNWHSMKVDVQVTGNIAPHLDWSMLCTMPSKIRVFSGPCYPCPARLHHWDAMILRDCYSGTIGMFEIPKYGTRFFDVLLMKLCEDFDHPWIMVAVKDSGPYIAPGGCYAL